MSDMPYRDVGYRVPLIGVEDTECRANCWCRTPYLQPPEAVARWTPTTEVPLWSWLGVAS